MLQSLRVRRCVPGRTEAILVGVAGWDELRGGAGVSSVHIRTSCFWFGLFCFCSVVVDARVLPFFSSFAGLVMTHVTGRLPSTFSVKDPWWMAMEKAVGAGSFNKCGCLQISSFDVGLFLLAGRGGEGVVETGSVAAGAGRRRGNRLAADMDCSSSSIFGDVQGRSKAELAGSSSSADVCWQQVAALLLISLASWWPLPPWSTAICWRRDLYYLQAFEPSRRPSGSGAVSSRCSTPSGAVPGGAAVGRRWARDDSGGEGARKRYGLDCFSIFCSRIFGVNFQDFVIISFFSRVLYVICTPPTAV